MWKPFLCRNILINEAACFFARRLIVCKQLAWRNRNHAIVILQKVFLVQILRKRTICVFNRGSLNNWSHDFSFKTRDWTLWSIFTLFLILSRLSLTLSLLLNDSQVVLHEIIEVARVVVLFQKVLLHAPKLLCPICAWGATRGWFWRARLHAHSC